MRRRRAGARGAWSPGRAQVLWGAGVAAGAVVVGVVAARLGDAPVHLAAALGAGGILVWSARRDWWQRAYAATLVLMIGATSSIAALATASYYSRYVAAVVLVVMTFHGKGRRPAQVPPVARRFYRAFCLLAAVAALSTLWSFEPATTALQAVALAILAALVRGLVTHRWATGERVGADLRVTYTVLVAASAASIVAGAVGLPGSTAFNGRLQGVFSNPNMLAMAATMAVPLGWAAYRSTRRLWWLGLAVVPVYAILQSGSRTALLAVALGIAWLVLRQVVDGRNVVPIAFAALAGTLALMVFGQGLLASQALTRLLQGGAADPLNGRMYAWSGGLELWAQRPVRGWGFQAGEAVFEASQGTTGFFFTRTAAHSSYVQILLELGVVGALVMGYLLLAAVRVALKGPGDGLAGAAGAVVVTGLAVFVTESAALGTGQVFPWAFWPVVVAGLLGRTVQAQDEPAGPPAAGASDAGASDAGLLREVAPR